MATLTLPPHLHPAGLAWKILRYLAAHEEPVHYTVLTTQLHHPRPQDVLNRCRELYHTGRLCWHGPGIYSLNQGEPLMSNSPTVKYPRQSTTLPAPTPLDPVKMSQASLETQRATGPRAAQATLAALAVQVKDHVLPLLEQEIATQEAQMVAVQARHKAELDAMIRACDDCRDQRRHLAAYLASAAPEPQG